MMAKMAETVLSMAWPDGVPASESVYLESLAPDRREEALRRLDALVKSEAGGSSVSLADIATQADLSRATFYQLRKRWAEERSLRSITPYEERRPRDIGTGPEHDRVRQAAEKLMGDHPEASDTAIVTMLKPGSKLGRSTVARLVGDARRGMRLTDVDLPSVYGRNVLVGLEGVRLRLVRHRWREEPDLVVCAFAVEEATGLILGHRLGEASASETLPIGAAWRALQVLRQDALDRPVETASTRVELKPMPALGAAHHQQSDTPERAAADGKQTVPGEASLTARFATRLKGLLIPAGDLLQLPVNDTDALGAWLDEQGYRESRQASGSILIAKAVEHHNQPILERLTEAGLIGENGVPAGAMASALLAAVDPPLD